MAEKAIVKVSQGEAQWIYYKAVVQCFACGSWKGDVTPDDAQIWVANHECEPDTRRGDK